MYLKLSVVIAKVPTLLSCVILVRIPSSVKYLHLILGYGQLR